jgi:hypothetical protein
MVQARENFPLSGEAFCHHPAHQCRVNELQGHLTSEQAIDALGQPNASHPAVPE